MSATIQTSAGERDVHVLGRTPHFVVHRAIGTHPRYTVTHTRTGLRLGDFPTVALARAAAGKLEAYGALWEFARLKDLARVDRDRLYAAWRAVKQLTSAELLGVQTP